MKYDFDHWDKTEMTQEEALAWFESELEVTDGKRCSPTCPQCQAEEWAIKALSVKRKKGFWEWGEDEDYRCSVCQKYVYGCLGEVLSGHYKFCPYCGCAMEGEEDDGEEIH